MFLQAKKRKGNLGHRICSIAVVEERAALVISRRGKLERHIKYKYMMTQSFRKHDFLSNIRMVLWMSPFLHSYCARTNFVTQNLDYLLK